jgi:hypothetical protein
MLVGWSILQEAGSVMFSSLIFWILSFLSLLICVSYILLSKRQLFPEGSDKSGTKVS